MSFLFVEAKPNLLFDLKKLLQTLLNVAHIMSKTYTCKAQISVSYVTDNLYRMCYDNSTIGDLNKNTEFEISIEY